jgi:histidinol-phosphate aminotransferase
MTMNIQELVRPNIRDLQPYSSARDEYEGEASVFLDANENALGSVPGGNRNRYPDPLQHEVKKKLAEFRGTNPANIFLGNGSDEAIDLLFRVFCEPGKDSCVIFTPTYGMYEVSAKINDVTVVRIPLTGSFDLPDPSAVLAGEEVKKAKLMFLCSPNNPSGNLLNKDRVQALLEGFRGIVVLDEAYIDFSLNDSLLSAVDKYDNLVVLQTFSKAWGMAALRLGIAYANEEIIGYLNKVKPPYNVNAYTQEQALVALQHTGLLQEHISLLVKNREKLVEDLRDIPGVEEIYPSDSNFILVKIKNSIDLYNYLVKQGIIVRNRNAVVPGCLRITTGTVRENQRLTEAIKTFQGI